MKVEETAAVFPILPTVVLLQRSFLALAQAWRLAGRRGCYGETVAITTKIYP